MKTADVSMDGVDHAGESAKLVNAAIANFGLALEEGGMDALSTVENFMDVWFMEQNTQKRPQFLQLVATDETLDKLVTEVCENGDDVVVRVALGVLNRLASEASIAAAVTSETRFAKLLKEAAKALEEKSLQERLMWLETMNSFVGLCPDQALVERLAKDTGFLKSIMDSIQVPKKAEKSEEQIYAELDGMLACKTVSLLCEVGSEDMINNVGREALKKQLNLLHEYKEWAHADAVGLHALLLLKAHSKMSKVWQDLEKEVELAGATIQVYADKGVRGCVSYIQYFNPVCSKCGKGDVKLLKCGRCHAVKYCSRECQKLDWSSHKSLCGKKTATEKAAETEKK